MREGAVLAALLAAIATAVLGEHVGSGGFMSDDWAIAEQVANRGYADAVAAQIDTLGSKPVLAVLLPAPYAVFGLSPELHLALALGLGAAVSLCLFAVLRMLSLRALEAGTISVLAFLFPWADAVRLWPTGSINEVSVSLYLVGVALALRGLKASARGAVGWHAAAVACFVAGVLTYEVVGPMALATGALYVVLCGRRAATPRWAADVAGVGAALGYSAATTAKGVQSPDEQIANAVDMAVGAAKLTADALVPADVPGLVVAIAAAAVLATAAWRMRRTGDRDLRRWLVIAAGSALALAPAYAMFVPGAYWTPQHLGLENRVNVLAALPMSVLVYAIVTLAALLLVARLKRPRAATAVATATCVAIGWGYAGKLRGDADLYQASYAAQRDVLAVMRASVRDLPAMATIFVVGAPAQVTARLPVFYDTWDLVGAARLRLADSSLHAFPVFSGTRLRCRTADLVAVTLPSPSSSAPGGNLAAEGTVPPVPYGRAVVVELVPSRATVPADRRSCHVATRRLRPAPFEWAPAALAVSSVARRIPPGIRRWP